MAALTITNDIVTVIKLTIPVRLHCTCLFTNIGHICTFCSTSLIVSAMDSRGYAFCRGCFFNGDPQSMLHLARTEERELFEFCASVTVNSLECHYSHTFHSMMIFLPDFQLRERLSLPNMLQTGRTLAVLQGALSGDQQVMGYDATTAAGAEGRNVG